MDSVDIFAIIVILIGVTILVPTLCYSLYKFHEISDTDFIKQRKKQIVYGMNFLTILSFCSERIYVICIQTLSFIETSIPQWTVYIAIGIFVWLFYTLFLIRTWLLFYSRNYHLDLIDSVWKKNINNNAVSWYIVNRRKYGSFQFMYKLAIIPFILYLCIEIGTDLIFGEGVHDHILNIILPFIIYIPIFILSYKIRDFNDTFYIRHEIYYQSITLFIIMIILTIEGTVFAINDGLTDHHNDTATSDDHGHRRLLLGGSHGGHHGEEEDTESVDAMHTKLERMEWLISAIMTYIALFVMSLISTAYPVFLYKKKKIMDNISDIQTDGSMMHEFNDMIKTFSTEDGYKKFMIHLVNHFATENLLFLTELIQIKHEYQKKNNYLVQIPKGIHLQFDNDKVDNIINPSNEYIQYDFTGNADIGKSKEEYLNISGNAESPSTTPTPSASPSTGKNNKFLSTFPSLRSVSNSQKAIQLKDVNNDKHSIFTVIFRKNGEVYCKIKIPSKIPQSGILEDYDNLFDQMKGLFYKYVKIGADYEINISFSQRLGLSNLFEGQYSDKIKSENDIFNIMGEVSIQILKLCYGSYHSFATGGSAIL